MILHICWKPLQYFMVASQYRSMDIIGMTIGTTKEHQYKHLLKSVEHNTYSLLENQRRAKGDKPSQA